MLIPYEMFAAAYACGNRIDSPNQHRTILISEDCRLVATNGHNMYISNAMADLEPRRFVVWEKPKKALLVRLDPEAVVGLNAELVELWRVPISENANDFPRWDLIAFKNIEKQYNIPTLWNISALKLIAEVFKTDKNVTYESGGAKNPARITGNHGFLWVMPGMP